MEPLQVQNLWAQANAKEITATTFKEVTGKDFDEYFKANKKRCLEEWRRYIKDRKTLTKLYFAAKKNNGCSCELEQYLYPNATQGPEKRPIRLWRCPKHGNRCAYPPTTDFTPQSLQ